MNILRAAAVTTIAQEFRAEVYYAKDENTLLEILGVESLELFAFTKPTKEMINKIQDLVWGC